MGVFLGLALGLRLKREHLDSLRIGGGTSTVVELCPDSKRGLDQDTPPMAIISDVRLDRIVGVCGWSTPMVPRLRRAEPTGVAHTFPATDECPGRAAGAPFALRT